MKMYKINKNNNFQIKNFDFIQIQILLLKYYYRSNSYSFYNNINSKKKFYHIICFYINKFFYKFKNKTEIKLNFFYSLFKLIAGSSRNLIQVKHSNRLSIELCLLYKSSLHWYTIYCKTILRERTNNSMQNFYSYPLTKLISKSNHKIHQLKCSPTVIPFFAISLSSTVIMECNSTKMFVVIK